MAYRIDLSRTDHSKVYIIHIKPHDIEPHYKKVLAMDIQCFLLTPSEQSKIYLRRYSHGGQCSHFGYHNAQVCIGEKAYSKNDYCGDTHPHDDDRWPTHCPCGYEFMPYDQWQHRTERLYRRSDTAELIPLVDAPTGAMWFATWMEDNPRNCGDDGRALMVRLPGKHDWRVDGRANNCDSPCKHCRVPYHRHGTNCGDTRKGLPHDPALPHYEDSQPHKCWVRHGEAPMIHVDKKGVTCGAGAGSISIEGYHGFLHHGKLTGC